MSVQTFTAARLPLQIDSLMSSMTEKVAATAKRIGVLITLLGLMAGMHLHGATEPAPIAVGLERDSVIRLAGNWRFQEDPTRTGETQEWFRPGSVRRRTAKVPLPWQLALPQLREFAGTA